MNITLKLKGAAPAATPWLTFANTAETWWSRHRGNPPWKGSFNFPDSSCCDLVTWWRHPSLPCRSQSCRWDTYWASGGNPTFCGFLAASFGRLSSCHRAGRVWILNVCCFRGHCALFVLMDGQLYPKLEQRFLPRKLDRAKWRPQEMAGEVDQQGPRGDEGWKDMRVLLRLCHYILGFEAHWPTIFLCLNFVVRYGESVP
ncbi:hypothetical protein OIU76_022239 [Salix suchowensis]|nr:hypothetical protein OIU76_022239 [Salix suchowensis]KAJ6374344.1 hypothetical protein OIU78_029955 [Salix suchowensis]